MARNFFQSGWIAVFSIGCLVEGVCGSPLTKASPPISRTRLQTQEVRLQAPLPPTGQDAYEHLQALCSWPHRRAGTFELAQAAAYCLATFRSYGYEAAIEEFPFPSYRLDSWGVAAEGRESVSFPIFYSGTTTPGSPLIAEVVTGDAPAGGRILYTSGADYPSQWNRAVQEGSLALLVGTDRDVFYTQDQIYARQRHVSGWNLPALPALMVEGGESLVGKTVTVWNDAALVEGTGYNVIARKPGRNGKRLLITGHLDSWFGGAVDDGTGASVTLDVARQLQGWQSDTEINFLVCDGEELGLLGSAAYIRKHGTDGLLSVLELDMASARNSYGGGADSISPFLVYSPNIEAAVQEFSADLPGTEIPFPAQLTYWTIGIRTDYEWYFGRGVPGLFVNTLTEFYHTPGDTIDLVDPANLQHCANACVRYVQREAEAPSPGLAPHHPIEILTWREGFQQRVMVEFDDGIPWQAPAIGLRVYHHGCDMFGVSLAQRSTNSYEGRFTPPFPGDFDLLVTVENGQTGIKWATIHWQ